MKNKMMLPKNATLFLILLNELLFSVLFYLVTLNDFPLFFMPIKVNQEVFSIMFTSVEIIQTTKKRQISTDISSVQAQFWNKSASVLLGKVIHSGITPTNGGANVSWMEDEQLRHVSISLLCLFLWPFT